MSNPSTSRVVSGNQTGTSPQGGLNNPRTANRESYNTFNRSRKRLSTQLFNQVQPMYCQAQIEGDVARLQVSHDLRSYTLKSPLLSDVQMHRTFFQVPWSAIMPNTWENLYRQPIKGSDIDYANTAPILYDYTLNDLCYFCKPYSSCFNNSSSVSWAVPSNKSKLVESIYLGALISRIFSRNSLLKNLGITLPLEEYGDNIVSFWVDNLLKAAHNEVNNLPTSSSSTSSITAVASFDYDDIAGNSHVVKLDRNLTLSQLYNAFQDIADNPLSLNFSFPLDSSSAETNLYFPDTAVTDITNLSADNYMKAMAPNSYAYYNYTGSDEQPGLKAINIMPLIAYQLIAAQYYSNPNIDECYTAKDWLNRMRGYVEVMRNRINAMYGEDFLPSSFTQNGVPYYYDVFAGINLQNILSLVEMLFDFDESKAAFVNFLTALFAPARSLRRGDYFVNSRTQPLAVGDVNVTVSDNKVSAIDMNKSMWVQRFLNAVNRASQNIYEYIQSLAGVTPARIAPQPNFICDESFRIGNFEVENTADEQGKVVTLFRNADSRYMYEVFIDEPSFIIGVNSFNMDFAYPTSTDKTWYMKDRLEWFNSFMQHAGDQAVELCELKTPSEPSEYYDGKTFGYQLRYAEFKNSISQATGGFLDSSTDLDSWSAIMDTADYSRTDVISSEFIRNRNEDFDKFYSSLTGSNPTTRFHFIIAQNIQNMVNSKQEAYPTLI